MSNVNIVFPITPDKKCLINKITAAINPAANAGFIIDLLIFTLNLIDFFKVM